MNVYLFCSTDLSADLFIFRIRCGMLVSSKLLIERCQLHQIVRDAYVQCSTAINKTFQWYWLRFSLEVRWWVKSLSHIALHFRFIRTFGLWSTPMVSLFPFNWPRSMHKWNVIKNLRKLLRWSWEQLAMDLPHRPRRYDCVLLCSTFCLSVNFFIFRIKCGMLLSSVQ